jgi:hypothetical protein
MKKPSSPLAWHRHKNMAGLNQLMESEHSLSGNWISSDNTDIDKQVKNLHRFTVIRSYHKNK